MSLEKLSNKENTETINQTYKPLVSIVTPTLNRVKYVEELIINLLNQTYPNIEHIFIDANSTDGTKELLAKYQAEHPERIRFISEPDKGIGDAVNKGWRLAKGEILGWIDVGDTYRPDAVEAVVESFRTSGADVVFGGGDMVNEKGELLRTYITKDFSLKNAINDKNQMHTPPAAFYKKEVISGLGWVTPDGGDTTELQIAVGQNSYKIQRIDKLIFRIRLQPDSITFSKEGRKLVRLNFRTGYLVCRKYGGSRFAPRCMKYYTFLVLDKLHIYDFVVLTVLLRLRKNSFINRLVTKLGMVTN